MSPISTPIQHPSCWKHTTYLVWGCWAAETVQLSSLVSFSAFPFGDKANMGVPWLWQLCQGSAVRFPAGAPCLWQRTHTSSPHLSLKQLGELFFPIDPSGAKKTLIHPLFPQALCCFCLLWVWGNSPPQVKYKNQGTVITAAYCFQHAGYIKNAGRALSWPLGAIFKCLIISMLSKSSVSSASSYAIRFFWIQIIFTFRKKKKRRQIFVEPIINSGWMDTKSRIVYS